MRLGLGLFVCVLGAGCGGRQHQVLGTGQVSIGAGGGGPTAAAGAVALPAQTPGGRYRVHYMIWLPRAMEVQWTLHCGGHEQSGTAGETFEQYRVRRTAEIQAERQQERQRRAQVGALIGNAVVGQAQAQGTVQTPNAAAQGTVTVDGAAAGAAAGAATVTDAPIVLAPDDLGQGYRQGDVGFELGDALGDGAQQCALEVAALDPAENLTNVGGSFTVERWFDAKHAERVRVAGGVTVVRADLRARLIARGADPTLAERRRQEAMERLRIEREAEEARLAEQRRIDEEREAKVRAERDAKLAQLRAEQDAAAERERVKREEERRQAQLELEIEAKARLDFEAHIRAEVMSTREALYLYYGKCGGNRHHREEVAYAEEQTRIRLEAEARMRLEMAINIRARLRGGLIARGADPGLRARLAAEAEAERQRRVAAELEENRRRAAAEEDERRRREAERARLEAEANARAAAELVAWQEQQAEQSRRVTIAAGVRAQMIDSLVAMGARVRPPMPDPVDNAGHWAWTGGQWMWIEGDTGITVPDVVRVDVGVGIGGGGGVHVDTSDREPVREHRSTVGDYVEAQPPPAPPPPTREQERDHRTTTTTSTTTTTTTTTTSPPPPPTRPKVRDHR